MDPIAHRLKKPAAIAPITAELRELGYDVRQAGEGERILAAAIVERFTLTSSGALGPAVEGSIRSSVHVKAMASKPEQSRRRLATVSVRNPSETKS